MAAQSMSSSGALDGLFGLLGGVVAVLWLLLVGGSLGYLIARHRRHGPMRLFGLKIAGALILPGVTALVGAFFALMLILSPGTKPLALLVVPAVIIATQIVYLRLVR